MKRILAKLAVRSATLMSRSSRFILERIWARKPSFLNYSELLELYFGDDRIRFERSAWIETGGIYRGKDITPRSDENLSAVVTMEYHRLEKGLALPNRRIGASQDVVVRLIKAINHQHAKVGATPEGAIGVRTLEVYFAETPPDVLRPEVVALLETFEGLRSIYGLVTGSSEGGYKIKSRNDWPSGKPILPENFLRSRHSVRDFSDEEIKPILVSEICEIALRAPSVCNRQPWRLYAILDKNLIRNALSYQNGNRGFTDLIPLLFIVTADQRRFVSAEERNQGWIDGGLFSMTVMLALHAKGMGSCPLNWSSPRANDHGLRNLIGIPSHESVIMMIAAGHLNDEFKVTASPRRRVADVLSIVERARA